MTLKEQRERLVEEIDELMYSWDDEYRINKDEIKRIVNQALTTAQASAIEECASMCENLASLLFSEQKGNMDTVARQCATLIRQNKPQV